MKLRTQKMVCDSLVCSSLLPKLFSSLSAIRKPSFLFLDICANFLSSRLAEVNKVPDWPETNIVLVIGQNANTSKRCIAIHSCENEGEAYIGKSDNRLACAYAFCDRTFFTSY